MKIALIGMSNIGKTTLASRLASESGFTHYCVDDMIEERLSARLKSDGFSGIADVSRWMGQPYEPRYRETSALYLQIEAECMRDILTKLREIGPNERIVIDTTGSVIYTGQEIMKQLRELSTVVHLESTEEAVRELLKRFLSDPKPLIWGRHYRSDAHPDPFESLKVCYPELLRYRMRQYRALAHVTVPYAVHRDTSFSPSQFMQMLT